MFPLFPINVHFFMTNVFQIRRLPNSDKWTARKNLLPSLIPNLEDANKQARKPNQFLRKRIFKLCPWNHYCSCQWFPLRAHTSVESKWDGVGQETVCLGCRITVRQGVRLPREIFTIDGAPTLKITWGRSGTSPGGVSKRKKCSLLGQGELLSIVCFEEILFVK